MTEPKFVPKPGQVDYTNIRYCPVVNVIPVYEHKVLLVQRSAELNFYPNYWHCIAGFLDDQQSITEKAYEELREELGWQPIDVPELSLGQVVITEAPEYRKTYLVIPMLARVKHLEFKLDWEAQRAKWYTPNEIQLLRLLPGFESVIDQFLPVI
ncbi:MAG TPA: NUDIX domain-containing protein [Verrucomicrobiae bacterium]|nr:NUDIX domain-containing protein [Verrucomicrobiae bacterium]